MSKCEKARGCLDVIYSSVMESKYRSALKTVQMMRNELNAQDKRIEELEAENGRYKKLYTQIMIEAYKNSPVSLIIIFDVLREIEALKGGEK